MGWRKPGGVGGLQSGLRMPDVGPAETGYRDTELADLVRGVALEIEIVLKGDALRGHQSDCRGQEYAKSPPFTEPSHFHGNLRNLRSQC